VLVFGLILFWTKTLVCKDGFITGIPLFRSASEDSALITSQKIFGSLSAVQTTCHPVRTLICPLLHPSGRCAIPSRRQTDQASSVWTTCFPFGPITVSRSFCSILHPYGRLNSPSRRLSVLDLFQILSKSKYWKITSIVRTMWYPVRTRVSLRQESQFKYTRPEFNHHWSGTFNR
jgi:hypothetical protein